jgi:hypothetical protein
VHDVLPFVPRPRASAAPTNDVRALVNTLVNDIQIIASFDRAVILGVLAACVHEQRIRVLREEQLRRSLVPKEEQHGGM